MILKSDISDIVILQNTNILSKIIDIKRDVSIHYSIIDPQLIAISGIRRVGKSSMLFQLIKENSEEAFYLNFEHPRLYNFEKNDFHRLDEIIRESNKKILFFEEIHIVEEWERYVSSKLDEGYTVVISGSSTLLLSTELGVKLIGRYVIKEIFPLSYHEYCSFYKKQKNENTLTEYIKDGGFPEYLKAQDEDYLNQLLDAILVREIGVQFGVRDLKTLKRIAVYLLSNVGTLVTGNRLKTKFGVGATSTVMEYLSHLEASYLMFFVPMFSYSVRKQMVNPRKVYAIDTGLINANTNSLAEKQEQIFENLVFLHLRREYSEIYYFKENETCDFVVFDKGKARLVVQVCFQLNQDNLEKEINGLFEACDFFELNEGLVLTLNQTDKFEHSGKVAKVVPAFEQF